MYVILKCFLHIQDSTQKYLDIYSKNLEHLFFLNSNLTLSNRLLKEFHPQ